MSENYINHLKDNISGYHLLGNSILNESNWKRITEMTMERNKVACRDNWQTKTSNLGPTVNLSFYRLTNACESVKDLVKEIDEVRSPSGDMMYFVLLKKEDKIQFKYKFFIIPHNLPIFEAKNYNWNPTFGKKGKYKGKQNGWQGHFDGNSGSKMKICFGTTYQMWVQLRASELADYKVCEFVVDKSEKSLTYGDIFNLSKQSVT